jgi:hypothetical protein
MSLSAKAHKSQPSNIPTGTDITASVSKAISTVYGLTGPMLEGAATAAAEDKKWPAVSTELNEQFDRGQTSYAAPEQSHAAFSMLRKCRYLSPDADDEAIVNFVASGLFHGWSRN